MKKKISGLCIILTSFILFIAGCSTNSNSEGAVSNEGENEDTIKLSLAAAHSTTHSSHTEFMQAFMDRVEELTEGKVEFEYFPAEQLGKASDLIDLARDGATDLA